MDCCSTNEKSEYSDNIEKGKGGKLIKMEKRLWLWIVIGVLFIAVLFLVFQAGGAENVVQTATSATKTAVSSSSGMVGGC